MHARFGNDKNIDLSQQIIENYRSVSQTVRKDYLEYLTTKSLAYAERCKETTMSAERAQAILDDGIAAVINRIFALLEPYTQEINRVNTVKDLHLTSVAPGRSNEALELDRTRKPSKFASFYRARFSTKRLSLVIRGLHNRVEFFIIGSDRVMGLSHEEALHKPIMIFEAQISAGDGLNWIVEDKPLTADRFERFSLLALEHLIDMTQEELVGSKSRI
jgi:hypothetical protein